MNEIHQSLPFLGKELLAKIEDSATIKDISAGTEILREGQFVKVIPIVLNGLLKVFSRFQDKELLLYYIRPKESCIMSFASSLKNDPSRVYAVTEEDSRILLIPVGEITGWIQQFPDLNTLFYQQYNLRYSELLDTISHVMFNKMDARLFTYLKEKSALTGQNPIKISHKLIASELGTAREVVSRVIKKLEAEGKVSQGANGIEIISDGD